MKNILVIFITCFMFNSFSQTINIGLVGCGFRGTGALINILEAAEMTNQISPQVKKERAAFLADVQSRIKMDLIKEYISSGEKANVLFETYKDGILKGHSDNFIEFVCESKENLRGTTGTVIPVSTDGESITGYLMSSSLS